MTTQANNSPADLMSRFFDSAGVIAVSIRSAAAPQGPIPMERVGKALGKTALMVTAVVGAGAWGAIEHRMSDTFHEVPLDQAILEVAAAAGGVEVFPTALSELSRRSEVTATPDEQPEKVATSVSDALAEEVALKVAAELNSGGEDYRLAITETALTWFENEGIMTFGVQDALARWGAYAHGDHYHIEEIPSASEELRPSPWALKSLIEGVALQGDMSAREAADSIDSELRTFMISSDLCEAGSDADCIARITDIASGEVVLEMDALSGEFGVRPQVLAEEDNLDGMRL